MFFNKNCPHCGKSARYKEILHRKDFAYFRCTDCQRYSFLVLSPKIRVAFGAMVAVSLLVAIFFGVLLGRALMASSVVVALFLGFFLLVPFFLDLESQEE